MLADRVGISLIGRSHESQDRLEATKLAISRWIERPERWGFVRRFEDPDLEAVFLDEYRRGGIRSIRAAIFATLLIFIAFALVASVSENNWYRAFADRLAAIAALSIFVTVLSLFSNFVVRFYIPVVASLVAISLLGVASSGKMVLDAVQNDVISPLGIIALVIVFAFMRLPAASSGLSRPKARWRCIAWPATSARSNRRRARSRAIRSMPAQENFRP